MEQRTLSAAYRFYCNSEHSNAHSAEADTVVTYEILKAQLDKYNNAEFTDKDKKKTIPIINDVQALHDFSFNSNSKISISSTLSVLLMFTVDSAILCVHVILFIESENSCFNFELTFVFVKNLFLGINLFTYACLGKLKSMLFNHNETDQFKIFKTFYIIHKCSCATSGKQAIYI